MTTSDHSRVLRAIRALPVEDLSRLAELHGETRSLPAYRAGRLSVLAAADAAGDDALAISRTVDERLAATEGYRRRLRHREQYDCKSAIRWAYLAEQYKSALSADEYRALTATWNKVCATPERSLPD